MSTVGSGTLARSTVGSGVSRAVDVQTVDTNSTQSRCGCVLCARQAGGQRLFCFGDFKRECASRSVWLGLAYFRNLTTRPRQHFAGFKNVSL